MTHTSSYIDCRPPCPLDRDVVVWCPWSGVERTDTPTPRKGATTAHSNTWPTQQSAHFCSPTSAHSSPAVLLQQRSSIGAVSLEKTAAETQRRAKRIRCGRNTTAAAAVVFLLVCKIISSSPSLRSALRGTMATSTYNCSRTSPLLRLLLVLCSSIHGQGAVFTVSPGGAFQV